MVSCEGERVERRKALPACAARFAKDVRAQLHIALMDVALEDTSGSQQMPFSTAEKLARMLRSGQLSLDDFSKAANEMMGNKGTTCDSLTAVVDAWELMQTGLGALAKALDWPELERGVRQLDRKLTTTARQTNKSAAQLNVWFKKVAGTYNRDLAQFRAFDGPKASLLEAVAAHENLYSTDTLRSLLATKDFLPRAFSYTYIHFPNVHR